MDHISRRLKTTFKHPMQNYTLINTILLVSMVTCSCTVNNEEVVVTLKCNVLNDVFSNMNISVRVSYGNPPTHIYSELGCCKYEVHTSVYFEEKTLESKVGPKICLGCAIYVLTQQHGIHNMSAFLLMCTFGCRYEMDKPHISPTLRCVLQLRICRPQWVFFNGVKGQTGVIVQSDPSFSINGSLLLGQR